MYINFVRSELKIYVNITFTSLTHSFMKLITYTDGGSRSNPGPAASGIVIKDTDGKTLASYGEYLGVATNNVAEYAAIISALKKARELGATEIECLADSKLVIEQLSGNWKVKEPNLQKLWLEAWNLLQSFKQYKLKHILRAKNAEADAEVNKILDKETGSKKKSFGEDITPIPDCVPPHAKRVFKGVLFDTYQWEQELFDGSHATFEKLVRKASTDMIVTQGDSIMVLKQEQPGKPLYPGLPGGQTEPGEDHLIAAQRELLEETGYVAENFILYKSQSDGGSKLYFPVSTYIVRDAQKIQEAHLDAGEKIQITWVNFDDFLQLARQEKFTCPLWLKFDMYEALLDQIKKEILRKTIFGD